MTVYCRSLTGRIYIQPPYLGIKFFIDTDIIVSVCQSSKGERNTTLRVRFPLKDVTCRCFLLVTSTDSAGDVKKTPQGVRAPSSSPKAERHQTFRGWVRFQNHRTRTEQINRVLPSVQTGGDKRWSSLGVSKGYVY